MELSQHFTLIFNPDVLRKKICQRRSLYTLRSYFKWLQITKRMNLRNKIMPAQEDSNRRTTTVIEEDGVEMARNHHRKCHLLSAGKSLLTVL